MRCPQCRSALDADRSCPNGHRVRQRDDVIALVTPEVAERVEAFSGNLWDYRAHRGWRRADPAILPALPDALAGTDPEWRARRDDLRRIRRALRGRGRCRVLDVGSFNGWLAHHLARDGHDVTALDIFDDAIDGLRARRHYPRPAWTSVQCLPMDLDLLDDRYDLVVLNRCLAFATDPVAQLRVAQARVAPGGLLFATGLAFFRDPSAKEAHWDAIRRDYHRRYGQEFFWLVPTRGLLDFDDRAALEAAGLDIVTQWRDLASVARSWVDPRKPRLAYGIQSFGDANSVQGFAGARAG